ncbi:Auxin-responsive protein SAUR71 [Zea mays]|uniref:Auxin-responsive protein SAUR71 n=1 Tax=Zea mays TaxID=4577 RepID=A0A1D6FTK7_MAIZE|nr:Auxin-responsive protein SAUR71 [Zea mays]
MVVGAEGEDTQRFIVPVELLGRPPIVELLRRAAQEYTYMRRGSLRIPFPLVAFRLLLSALAGPPPPPAPTIPFVSSSFSRLGSGSCSTSTRLQALQQERPRLGQLQVFLTFSFRRFAVEAAYKA